MNFRAALFLFLFLFVFKGAVYSQETSIVTIIPSKQVVAAKGQTVQLTVRAKIKKGFHIQANPASDEFLIPTILTIKANEGIVPDKPVYHPGHTYRLKGSSEDLLTYEDGVIIKMSVKVLDFAPAGKVSLTGKLDFQPCDDRKCLFPRSVPVVIPVEIVDLAK